MNVDNGCYVIPIYIELLTFILSSNALFFSQIQKNASEFMENEMFSLYYVHSSVCNRLKCLCKLYCVAHGKRVEYFSLKFQFTNLLKICQRIILILEMILDFLVYLNFRYSCNQPQRTAAVLYQMMLHNSHGSSCIRCGQETYGDPEVKNTRLLSETFS